MEEIIEQALDEIHSNRESPLNMANLVKHSQAIDPTITETDIWGYMTPMYGWDPERGFWSEDQTD